MKKKRWSFSAVTTALVVGMVAVSLLIGTGVFLMIYQRAMIQSVRTSSSQITEQVSDIVEDYMADIRDLMNQIRRTEQMTPEEREEFLSSIAMVRPDVTAITAYDRESGALLEAWTGQHVLKEQILVNLSFDEERLPEEGELLISKPHVESILVNEYPWVVSISGIVKDPEGREQVIVLDTRFSQIASYIDNVGIGKHGYCFIMDEEGNIVYHPQQQLIFAGLKGENTELLESSSDGSLEEGDMIYTIRSEEENNWRIVAVSYVDELIAEGLRDCLLILGVLLLLVLIATLICSIVLSNQLSKPIKRLISAMRDFEKDAASFSFQPAGGSREMTALSDSFGHMVVRIQELMARVRNEEIILRKTELRALLAQINPHFLYNTLDSIAWMCEDGRNKEAVDMVNALARLFRISISKGHELIPIEKEVEHAKSYLQIQKFRYKNQFEYFFDVEEQCLHYYCNKITLQPIIENAIYHGLNRMIEEGVIRIRIWEEDGDVIFSVSDNGVGMTKEQCDALLKEDSGRETGIGMKNVNDRVRIYFGEKYGMRIESEPDEGTTVYIRMPKLEEEPHESR